MGLDLCVTEGGKASLCLLFDWTFFHFKLMPLFLFSTRHPAPTFLLLLFIKVFSQGDQVNLSILWDRWLMILNAWNVFQSIYLLGSSIQTLFIGQTPYHLLPISHVHWDVMYWAQQWHRKGFTWTRNRRRFAIWVYWIEGGGMQFSQKEQPGIS